MLHNYKTSAIILQETTRGLHRYYKEWYIILKKDATSSYQKESNEVKSFLLKPDLQINIHLVTTGNRNFAQATKANPKFPFF